MKKLLLFSPLFLATLATGMIKNPASLRYLAAIKVPEHKMGTLHRELKVYAQQVKKIEITVKKAKEAAEIATYRSQLKLLCAIPTGDPHLCEEIYSTTPHLYDLKTIHQMLKLCMLYSNTSIAPWIFERFPTLKQNGIMEEILLDTIKAHNVPMARYILDNNQYPHIYTQVVFQHILQNQETADLLLPYIGKELQRESTQNDQDKWVTNNLISAVHHILHFRESDTIINYIFLNYEHIKELCQEMLCEKVSNYLLEIEDHPSHNSHNEDRCTFAVKLLNHSSKQKIQHSLNRVLARVLSVSAEHIRSENVNFLLELGADRLNINSKGQIPLQILLSQPIEKFIRQDGYYIHHIDTTARETVELLLSSFPQQQVCHIDGQGNTALHYPSAGIVMDWLTENGGAIDKLNNQGKTPLLTFVANNTQAFTACDNDRWGWGYPTIFFNLFSQYLHSTPHATLMKNKAEILKQLHLLPHKLFKDAALKLLEEIQIKWLIHTPKQISNATFQAARNSIITMPKNQCNAFFSDITAFVIKPEIKKHDSLYFALEKRRSHPQSTQTNDNNPIEKSALDRMEDVD